VRVSRIDPVAETAAYTAEVLASAGADLPAEARVSPRQLLQPIAGGKSLTRVYNDQWQYFVSKDGKYVPTNNKWYDLTSTFPRS